MGEAAKPFVMIVDDELDTRELMREFLELEGYRAQTYPNGKVALEALVQGEKPGIILLDWRMPVMSGGQFLERFRELPQSVSSIPVFLFSAESDPRMNQACCAGVIRKPLDFERLLSVLEEYSPQWASS